MIFNNFIFSDYTQRICYERVCVICRSSDLFKNDPAPDTIVYDIVYNPQRTLLIKEAQARGLKTIGGLDMLIYQAQRAIEIWTGKTPDFNVMKLAAIEALR